MPELLTFESSILDTIVRGSVLYLLLVVILRVIPKRETGSLSANDMIGLVIVGNLAGQAIAGETTAGPDLLLLIAVVLLWGYLFNLLEFYFPRLRRVAQDTPTLLVYDGKIIHANLRHEKLTEQELSANVRKSGISDISMVKQAVLEADGHISVVPKDGV